MNLELDTGGDVYDAHSAALAAFSDWGWVRESRGLQGAACSMSSMLSTPIENVAFTEGEPRA